MTLKGLQYPVQTPHLTASSEQEIEYFSQPHLKSLGIQAPPRSEDRPEALRYRNQTQNTARFHPATLRVHRTHKRLKTSANRSTKRMLQTTALQNHSSAAGSFFTRTPQRFFATAGEARKTSRRPPGRPRSSCRQTELASRNPSGARRAAASCRLGRAGLRAQTDFVPAQE